MSIKSIALKAGVAGALLLAGTAASFAASAVATSGVNVRLGPGTQYGIVDQLYAGEQVEVYGCQGSWCQISHTGPDGWVSANYLTRGDGYYDDDYYEGPDFIIRSPRPSYRPWYGRPYPRRPYSSFCVGGPNARFCISN